MIEDYENKTIEELRDAEVYYKTQASYYEKQRIRAEYHEELYREERNKILEEIKKRAARHWDNRKYKV